MKKETKLILLIGWFILSAVIYFSAVSRQFEPIMPIYMAMSIIFGVAFVLVNGGFRSTVKASDSTLPSLSRKQKARMRYKTEESVADEAQSEPRMNIFGLSDKMQKMLAELFLILFLAPTVVLALDYILIAFLPFYE